MNRFAWLSPIVICAVLTSCGSVDTLDPAGAAGSSGGGQTGSAGGGGHGGKSCTDYLNDYAAAVNAAKTCNAAIDIVQCQHIVASTLGCAGCATAVNDRSELDRIAAAYLAAPCPIPVCAEIACPAVARGQCVAISSGDVCADVSPAAN